MGNYFFKMSKAEKNDILDKHKTVYDGFVTEYGQAINQQTLYVQDFANDKNGITVSNKGEVKSYTNININESIDSYNDYEEDTLPYEDENEVDFISVGSEESPYEVYEKKDEEEDWVKKLMADSYDSTSQEGELGENWSEKYKKSIDCKNPKGFSQKAHCQGRKKKLKEEFQNRRLNLNDDELNETFNNQLNESLNMFKRFNKYN